MFVAEALGSCGRESQHLLSCAKKCALYYQCTPSDLSGTAVLQYVAGVVSGLVAALPFQRVYLQVYVLLTVSTTGLHPYICDVQCKGQQQQ